jgi:hypothetical protein
MRKGGTRKGWVDHIEKGLWVKGITKIRVARGIQWCKSQIRGPEVGRVHGKKKKKKKKKMPKNDRYDYD